MARFRFNKRPFPKEIRPEVGRAEPGLVTMAFSSSTQEQRQTDFSEFSASLI